MDIGGRIRHNKGMEKMTALWKRVVQQKELLIILLIAFSILFALDTLLVQGSHREEKYRESLMVERLQAQVQSSLNEHVTALIALKVVYQNFYDISHYDFQQYGQSITSDLKGFRRLFYIDPAMTIREVYPLNPENRGLIGYSLKENRDIVKLLDQARQKKQPATSRLLPFLSHPKSYWAAIPIYRNNREFLGYAAGELSLESIWQPYIQSLDHFQLQLVDPDGTELFQQVSIDERSPTLIRMPFDVGGQKNWTLVLNPLQLSSAETLALQRGSLWMGGLMILTLVIAMVQAGRRHKTEMEEAQKQFETMFEASPDGILLLNEKLELQISNPVVRQWLGKPEEELTGRSFFDFFSCQCPNINKCAELSHLLCASKGIAAELPDMLETQIIDPPEGSPRNLRLNASMITQERDGRREKGFICVLGDISTIKELERVKETYVATLTHDLKTPLLAQQMVLERIVEGRAGKVSQEQNRLLSGAIESVHDMLDMVNITLLFYKLETSNVTLQRQRLPVANVLREVLGNLQPLAEKRGMTLELETALDLPDVSIDPIQMKRVFQNLISNAITYGLKGSPIAISIHAQQGGGGDTPPETLLVEIRNQGKGIPAEDLPRIFDKYYSQSRRFKQIGTGLGLYISRRIVELHGGKIWAESEPDKETRFYVTLPCAQQLGSGPAEDPLATAAVNSPTTGG